MTILPMNAQTFNQNPLVEVFYAVIDGVNQLAVNARDLHSFLAVKTRFNDWIKSRINEYKFAINLDFISFTEKSVKPKGGRPTTEYHLTLDMAKELAMVENNDKGREVRRYFIQCEKSLFHTDSKQREILVSACTKLSVGNKSISKVYTDVANRFGYNKPVEIPSYLLAEAIAYVYEELLAQEKARKANNINHDMVEVMQDMEKLYNYTTDTAVSLIRSLNGINAKYQLSVE